MKNTWSTSGHTRLPRRKTEVIKSIFVYRSEDAGITGEVLSTPNRKERENKTEMLSNHVVFLYVEYELQFWFIAFTMQAHHLCSVNN